MIGWLVILPILLPLSTGVAAAACAGKRVALARGIADAGYLLVAFATAALAAAVSRHGTMTIDVGGWPAEFAISLVADHAAIMLIGICLAAALAIRVFGLVEPGRCNSHSSLPLLLLSGANGAFLAGDLFNLYVWFEVVILSAITILLQQNRDRDLNSLRPYLLVNIVGSALLLLGVGLAYGATGTVHLEALGSVFPELESSTQAVVAAPVVIAFALKAAAFPLFSWMPSAYSTLSPGAAALFSALMTKLGVYALFRILGGPFASVLPSFQTALVIIACATMLSGVLAALAQMDIRRLLAYHIVSQIGYLLLAGALSTLAAATSMFFFLAHVVFAKAALFLLAGLLARAYGTYDLRQLGGVLRQRPLLAILFAIPALALAGLPPLSGFWAKLFVIKAALGAEAWGALAIALIVSVLTLISMLKIWMYVFWRRRVDGSDDHSTAPPLAKSSVSVGAALAALSLLIGLWPGPLFDISQAAALDMFQGARE